jgi:hypothetical protein
MRSLRSVECCRESARADFCPAIKRARYGATRWNCQSSAIWRLEHWESRLSAVGVGCGEGRSDVGGALDRRRVGPRKRDGFQRPAGVGSGKSRRDHGACASNTRRRGVRASQRRRRSARLRGGAGGGTGLAGGSGAVDPPHLNGSRRAKEGEMSAATNN